MKTQNELFVFSLDLTINYALLTYKNALKSFYRDTNKKRRVVGPPPLLLFSFFLSDVDVCIAGDFGIVATAIDVVADIGTEDILLFVVGDIC